MILARRLLLLAGCLLAAFIVRPVAAQDRPLQVADAYHGVGVRYCLEDGRQPATIADVYHGLGIAVCV